MGVLDFITQGQAPPNTATSGTTQTNLPSWLNDYAMNSIAQANQIAAQPYTPYPGPRIAGFTQPQNQAFNLAQSNVGNWQPSLSQSSSLINSATAPGAGGLSQAQPYLSQASGTFTNPNTVNSYMNPYVGDVIKQGTNLAMQNYNQNLKPALDNQFTAAGQYGSSAHERAGLQMGNQLTQNLQQADQGALGQAYNTAGSMFNNDMSRIAGIGSTAGTLGTQGQYANLAGAGQLGALGQMYQGLGTGDVSNLGQVGALQQQQNQSNLNLGYQNFQDQLNWPKTQMNWRQGLVSSLPYGTKVQDTKNGPAPFYGPTPASSILGTASTGYGTYKTLFPNGIGVLGKLFGGNGGGASTNPGSYDYSGIDQQLSTPGIDTSNMSFSDPSQNYNFSDYSGGLNNLSLDNLSAQPMKRGGLATVFRGGRYGR